MKRLFLFLILAVLAACSREAPPTQSARRPVTDVAPGQADIGGTTVSLPKRIGEWTRPDAARRVTAETIFDYMDGGGELYLAYRFDHLDVFEFKASEASLGTILVEIYSMKSSDDAFGLLSNDWGGEAVALAPARVKAAAESRAAPPQRALYGGGLLRLCSGASYVRILASRETPESRAAVLKLGEEVTRNDAAPGTATIPGIVDALARGGTGVRPDRTCFFRSHLVLNSQYFLASQDILGLGLDVDAATTEVTAGAAGARPERLIAIRYPSAERAASALRTFAAAYLPDAVPKGRAPGATGFAKVEHGWVGWASRGPNLVIVLDASTADAARERAAAVLRAQENSTSK